MVMGSGGAGAVGAGERPSAAPRCGRRRPPARPGGAGGGGREKDLLRPLDVDVDAGQLVRADWGRSGGAVLDGRTGPDVNLFLAFDVDVDAGQLVVILRGVVWGGHGSPFGVRDAVRV